MSSAEQRRRQMLMEQEKKDRELAERLSREEWQTPPRPTRRANRGGRADAASPASSTRGRGRGRGRGRPPRTNQRARSSPSPSNSTDSDGSSVRIVPTPPRRQLAVMASRRGPSLASPRPATMNFRGAGVSSRRQSATMEARGRGSVRGRGRGRPQRTNQRARSSPSPSSSTDSAGSSVRIVRETAPPRRQIRMRTPPREMQARREPSVAPPRRQLATMAARRGSSTAAPRSRGAARMTINTQRTYVLTSSDDDSEEDNDNERVLSPAISASYIRSLLNPLLRRNPLHQFARTAMNFSDTDSNDEDYDGDSDDVSMASVEDDDDEDDIRILDDIGPLRAEENNIRQPIFEEDRDMYNRELDLYHDEDEYQVPPPRVVQGRGKAAEPDPTWGDCTMCSSTPTKPQGCKKCLQFLGCADCVRRWHGARQSSFDRPNCPLCRAPWNGDTPGVLLMPTIEKHRLKNAAKASSSSSGPSTSAGPSSSS